MLLNEAATFGLYEGMKKMAFVGETNLENVDVLTYCIALLSFLTAPLAGILIGFLVGLLAAFVTKHTR